MFHWKCKEQDTFTNRNIYPRQQKGECYWKGTIIQNAENNSLLFIIIIFRFVVSLAFYGVILNVGNLGGDFYLNLFLLTIIDYPVKFLTLLLLNRIGRKKVYVAYMLLGGIMCMGTIYPVVQKHECKFL